MLPWLKNNVGILGITIDKKPTPEPIDWMQKNAEEFIKMRSKKMPISEIKKL